MKGKHRYQAASSPFPGRRGIDRLIGLCVLCCLWGYLTGCGRNGETGNDPAAHTARTETEAEIESLGDAEISLPAGLIGDEVSDSQIAYRSEDGSYVVYALSGKERSNILRSLSQRVSDSIEVILADEDRYPDIESITASDDYTEFTIALTGGSMNTYESMLAVSFYIIGNKYQIYYGVTAEEALTVVRYVDADSGDVVSETDSRSLEIP